MLNEMMLAAAGASGMAKPLLDTGAKLIENLLGKPCSVAGEMLSDQLYFWQWKNRISIAAKAKAMLDNNKIAERVVPPTFLLPLLEAAGNVEDESLQDLWAKLLAA